MSTGDLGDLSMLELFRMEVESQRQVLITGLLSLEHQPDAAEQLEACMRAAHSLKGAARIIELDAAVTLAHQMENTFVAAQQGHLTLGKPEIDKLLQNVDELGRMAGLTAIIVDAPQGVAAVEQVDVKDRVLRVTAEHLNRLLGLSGESLVESRRLKPFADSLLRLKRGQANAGTTLDSLREALLEHNRRATSIAQRMYDEALACQMRPFADGIQAFPRMVRDVARTLGKQARLEITGEATQVDRDVLEKLEGPLGHLLRNAVDHGIESPEEREASGKPPEGVVRLEARHSAGTLQISISDDGCGIALDRVRETIVARELATEEMAGKLSDAELLEFLFLPGFTVKETITEISGRGVGLDAVQNVISKQLRGGLRATSIFGQGTRFQLNLPLTLSVVRSVLVEIANEPYACPLAYVVKSLYVQREDIESVEGRQHFKDDGRHIGLVAANQLFGREEPAIARDRLPVIVLGDHHDNYGLVVDRFLGIRELVVRPLDPRLGKIKDVSAGALLEDGSPLFIIDVDDVILSIKKLVSSGHLSKVRYDSGEHRIQRKRVLVVDDSLTVRELERKLLESAGYEVEVAVDGADGWNAVRTGQFNLIVTDIDMPRMDGIELVKHIKKDARLQSLPVMVVSYKDREEDRQRGLEAGADFYLTKGSFHDETLLEAVVDLVGEAEL